jgi:hypothetical protein
MRKVSPEKFQPVAFDIKPVAQCLLEELRVAIENIHSLTSCELDHFKALETIFEN